MMAPPSKRRLHLNKLKERRSSSHTKNKMDTSSSSEESDTEINNCAQEEPLDITLENIGDLFELCTDECSIKYLSVLLYMTLKHFGVTWAKCEAFLNDIGSFRAQATEKWAQIFVAGNMEDFQNENRGGKYRTEFYDHYPEIEYDARQYALERCSQKAADFKVAELATFINKKYYEISNLQKNPDDILIRSITSCRLDLLRWGASFKENSQRPYFEGHERPDVVEHRQEFINYFLDRQNNYYRVTDGDNPGWTLPTQNTPCILLFHDESTFRSGEVCKKRWFLGNESPFLSKGKGRSYMVSDFLVQHHSGPFFNLSESEYKKAVRKYPQLANDTGVKYIERTATGSINVGQDGYFDNSTVLEQFERLFQLLEFKEAYKNHNIECIVDNARTHSAKSHSLLDFGKSIGTRCPVDKIEYKDVHGKQQTLHCFFQRGPNSGKSKCLLSIAKELKLKVPEKILLDDLRTLLSNHPAFQSISRLEQLAEKYGVTIKFCPKFHCELNCIEGLWCSQKQYVRQKTDQTFNTMLKLIVESRGNFENKKIHLKLIRRFWKCLSAYKDGQSYEQVMKMFFSEKCTGTVKNHTRISNMNINI